MELLILLVVLLLILLVSVNRIKNKNTLFKKARRILGMLAIFVSVAGVITTFNMVYCFLCAYILLLMVWLFSIGLKEK